MPSGTRERASSLSEPLSTSSQSRSAPDGPRNEDDPTALAVARRPGEIETESVDTRPWGGSSMRLPGPRRSVLSCSADIADDPQLWRALAPIANPVKPLPWPLRGRANVRNGAPLRSCSDR